MSANPKVIVQTDKGAITIELFPEAAPETVANFLAAVDAGFYGDTIFHRVIKGFMIQGGGLDADMGDKEWKGAPVKNEAATGLSNERGTIAMARTMDPHSATAQFYINTVDNPELDHTSPSPSGYGYCVFGKVSEGMDVVDKIEKTKVKEQGMHESVPVDSVVITGASRFE